jgi:hypothetical protein
MSTLVVRAACGIVLLLVGVAGLLPCVCGDMTGSMDPGAGTPCHDDGPGLSDGSMSCACACMSAAPRDTAVPRLEPAFAFGLPGTEPTPAPAVSARRASVPVPLRQASPPLPPLILRI